MNDEINYNDQVEWKSTAMVRNQKYVLFRPYPWEVGKYFQNTHILFKTILLNNTSDYITHYTHQMLEVDTNWSENFIK
jgi:hypothetical protein